MEYQLSILILIFALSLTIYFNDRFKINLENFIVYQIKKYKRKSLKISIHKLPKIFGQTVQALFEKEYFSLWRNIRYKRLKLITFSSYLSIMVMVTIKKPEYYEIWVTVLGCLFIWLHFVSRFNEKYAFAEPLWFIKTQPMKFRHIFLAKYFNELPILTFFVFCTVLFLNIHAAAIQDQIGLLLLILIFAHLVLFSMINLQIMFFDNQRLAEYSFHISVTFLAIMIFNYPLVGPIIAFSLTMYFVYKNVKYLNR